MSSIQVLGKRSFQGWGTSFWTACQSCFLTLGQVWAGIFGLIAAAASFRNGWKATALPLSPETSGGSSIATSYDATNWTFDNVTCMLYILLSNIVRQVRQMRFAKQELFCRHGSQRNFANWIRRTYLSVPFRKSAMYLQAIISGWIF